MPLVIIMILILTRLPGLCRHFTYIFSCLFLILPMRKLRLRESLSNLVEFPQLKSGRARFVARSPASKTRASCPKLCLNVHSTIFLPDGLRLKKHGYWATRWSFQKHRAHLVVTFWLICLKPVTLFSWSHLILYIAEKTFTTERANGMLPTNGKC